jgi:hypothetical protein
MNTQLEERPGGLVDHLAADLSLDVQELEAMEAPDFWDGFVAGLGVATVVGGGIAVGVAIT